MVEFRPLTFSPSWLLPFLSLSMAWFLKISPIWFLTLVQAVSLMAAWHLLILLACRFRKRYNFLFDENFPAEKEVCSVVKLKCMDALIRRCSVKIIPSCIFWYLQRLQKMIKKSKDPNAIEEMKSRITWIVRITS